jgi:hypothetical protein
MPLRKGNEKARIVQFADEGRTLPDGSKIIYAENDDKIVVYHKHPLERGTTYVYDRKSGKITVNGKEGTNHDKKIMIRLGSYLMDNTQEYELVTVSVSAKGDH